MTFCFLHDKLLAAEAGSNSYYEVRMFSPPPSRLRSAQSTFSFLFFLLHQKE